MDTHFLPIRDGKHRQKYQKREKCPGHLALRAAERTVSSNQIDHENQLDRHTDNELPMTSDYSGVAKFASHTQKKRKRLTPFRS